MQNKPNESRNGGVDPRHALEARISNLSIHRNLILLLFFVVVIRLLIQEKLNKYGHVEEQGSQTAGNPAGIDGNISRIDGAGLARLTMPRVATNGRVCKDGHDIG